jgi:uncharacterized oligopeptide transporter (OPT) family protein
VKLPRRIRDSYSARGGAPLTARTVILIVTVIAAVHVARGLPLWATLAVCVAFGLLGRLLVFLLRI